MAVTPTSIKERFPEFAAVPDSRIQFFIDDAVLYLNEARASIYYDKLLALLTAHYLALALQNETGSGGGKGLIASMSDGDSSISFATMTPGSQSEFYFNQTPYGVEFLTWRVYMSGGGIIV